MYITYDRDQWEIISPLGHIRRQRNYTQNRLPPPSEHKYAQQDISSFKPTWLIRVSDMQLVRGSEVRGQYHTLSYSWNQSGDYYKSEYNNKYIRDDRGKHKVISYRKRRKRELLIWRGKKTRMLADPRFVKFEGLIQQICKDFGVQYIWWDQCCIDQSSAEEKQREIKQMHRIYKNSYCTLVLIPELKFPGIRGDSSITLASIDTISNSEWVKRMWTLEEAFMSKRLLFIGTNLHMWSYVFDHYGKSDQQYYYHLLDTICGATIKWNACVALQLSRKRTSTNAHDRYFALANIFSDKFPDFDFSYARPLSGVALQFYECVAKDDPSILYFGLCNTHLADEERILVRRPEDIFLPSWTGVNGAHAENLFNREHDMSYFGLSHADYIVSGSSIYLTCTSISVSIQNSSSCNKLLDWWDKPISEPGQLRSIRSSSDNTLVFVTAPPGTRTVNTIYSLDNLGLEATHYLPLKRYWETGVNTTLSPPEACGGVMSLTEDCSHCIILYGVRYEHPYYFYGLSPVVKKYGDYYKSIGLCALYNFSNFKNIDVKAKRAFEIK